MANWQPVPRYRICLPGYMEQLYKTNPPRRHFPLAGLQIVAADPPINQCHPFAEVQDAMKKLKVGDATETYNISAETLKAGG